jgi:hypothetical protein
MMFYKRIGGSHKVAGLADPESKGTSTGALDLQLLTLRLFQALIVGDLSHQVSALKTLLNSARVALAD